MGIIILTHGTFEWCCYIIIAHFMHLSYFDCHVRACWMGRQIVVHVGSTKLHLHPNKGKSVF